MSDRASRGKRRAEPTTKRRRRDRDARPAGKRADRPENHEGMTPEFLQQLREPETEDMTSDWSEPSLRTAPVSAGPGIRELLAGIDADLRSDQVYQDALSRLAYG